MQLQHSFEQNALLEEEVYSFVREEGEWYIQPPSVAAKIWNKEDLRMTEGAPKFLNTVSNGIKKLRLQISRHPFEGCGLLEAVEHCPAPRGGAIYLFTPAEGEKGSTMFWICDLALLVFGDIPDCIYLRRL